MRRRSLVAAVGFALGTGAAHLAGEPLHAATGDSNPPAAAIATPSDSGSVRLAMPDPLAHTARFVLLPLRTLYALPARFLAGDGDRAWISGRTLRSGSDYLLDRGRGEVRILTEFVPGETLVVAYRRLPIAGALAAGREIHWSDSRPDSAVVADSGARGRPPLRSGVAAAAGDPASNGAQFEFSGNKSVAVEFGSRQDAALRQSFDLATRGRLGGGTEVVALLSDRHTPVANEGVTRELRELDRLLVEVRGAHGAATLGDVALLHEGGAFGTVTRELTGARVQGNAGGARAQAAVATAKGRYRTAAVAGVDGVQGPYALPDDDGATGLPVVINSDVVWLDGERLERGGAADYTIDYARGRLTFSPRRVITSASRIQADYQLADGPYRRNALAVSAAGTAGALEAFVHAYRESDDPRHANTTALTEQDRLILAAVGDSASLAVAPAIYGGPGDYDRVVDPAGAARYAFAGRDAGAYRVDFAAAAGGEYAESTLVAGTPSFRWVGAGRGTHAPVRRLSLPATQEILGGGARLALGAHGSVRVEGAASRRDANRLSALDEGDDRGAAGRFDASFAPPLRLAGRDLGTLAIDAGARRLDERFAPLSRIDPPQYAEEWGAAPGTALESGDEGFLRLAWRPRERMSIGGERARLSEADGERADRWRAHGEWMSGGARPLSQRLRYEHVDAHEAEADSAPGAFERWRYDGRWQALAAFAPRFAVDAEDRRGAGAPESSAFRARSWNAGADGRIGFATWSGGVDFRREFGISDGDAYTRRTARGAQLSLTGAPHPRWSASLGASRRWIETDAGEDRVDYGHGRLRQDGSRGGVGQEIAAEWTSEGETRRERAVFFVGEGAGAYDSLGNFVGRGDYDVALREVDGANARLSRTQFSWRAEARPRRASGSGGRVTALVQSSASRRGPMTLGNFFPLPSRLAGDETLAAASFLGRIELETSPERAQDIRLVGERRGGADRQYVGAATTTSAWSAEARGRARRGGRWLFELGARSTRSEAQQSAIGVTSAERALVEWSGAAEATWVRDSRLRLAMTGLYERASLRGGESGTQTRIGPRALYAYGDRVRVEALARVGVARGETVPTLLPSGFPVRPDRFDCRLDVAWRVGRRGQVSAQWTGRTPVGADFDQSGRAELRVNF